MSYRLVIDAAAAAVMASMDESTHGLFVMATLDLPGDPHGLGRVVGSTGAQTKRAHAIGAMGMIIYLVDDETEVVTVTDVAWLG